MKMVAYNLIWITVKSDEIRYNLVEISTSWFVRVTLTVVSLAIRNQAIFTTVVEKSQRRHCTNERNQDNY